MVDWAGGRCHARRARGGQAQHRPGSMAHDAGRATAGPIPQPRASRQRTGAVAAGQVWQAWARTWGCLAELWPAPAVQPVSGVQLPAGRAGCPRWVLPRHSPAPEGVGWAAPAKLVVRLGDPRACQGRPLAAQAGKAGRWGGAGASGPHGAGGPQRAALGAWRRRAVRLAAERACHQAPQKPKQQRRQAAAASGRDSPRGW